MYFETFRSQSRHANWMHSQDLSMVDSVHCYRFGVWVTMASDGRPVRLQKEIFFHISIDRSIFLILKLQQPEL